MLQERKRTSAHNWNKVYAVEVLPGGEKVLVKMGYDINKEEEFATAAAVEDLFSILREARVST